jgi:Tfp pilus assembly protein PilV
MKQANRPGGFTLMEAAVALAVFTVGMLGLAGVFSQIVHANATSKQKQIAARLAERKLAQFRLTNAGELTQTGGTFEAPFDDYTWEARFRAQSRDLGIMDVWVEVTHRSGAGVRLWSQMVVPDDR